MSAADVVILVMAVTEQPPMLENDDLRDVDQTILSYMDDGRVTPVYCKKRLSDDGMDYSRGYVQERLSRLVEHDHAENSSGDWTVRTSR